MAEPEALEPTGDEPQPRSDAFFGDLGVSPQSYATSMARSIARALADPVDTLPSPWTPVGARNIGGRIRALAQDSFNPSILYAGTAYGGVFRSRDDGDTWAPIGGPENSFPVGALAVDAQAHGTLYVGSGEPLIFHEVDTGAIRGKSWDASGAGFYRADTSVDPVRMTMEVGPYSLVGPRPGAADRFSRIVCDPGTTGRCWIASDTGLWRREPGVGAAPPSFAREPVPAPPPVLPALPAAPAIPPSARPAGAGITDIAVTPNPDPKRPGTWRLFAAVGAQGIYRGVFDPAATPPATVWEPAPLGGGLPAPGSVAGGLTHDRIRVAACASQPQHLYAVFEDGAVRSRDRVMLDVFHSEDGGDSWQASGQHAPAPTVSELLGGKGQPWAHLVIEVHPDNPAIAVVGSMNVVRTLDFGRHWTLVMDWQNWSHGDRAQHGDIHALVFDANDPRRLWVGNDSGLSVTPDIVQGNPRTDQGWRKRSHGIVAAQFNDIAVHPVVPYMLGGGLQDNGSYITFGGESWYAVGDADGGQIAFEHKDPRSFIAPNQERVIRSTVQAPTSTDPNPRLTGYPFVQRRIVNADQDAPNDTFAVLLDSREQAPMNTTAMLFVPVVEHHPLLERHLLVGRGYTSATAVQADVFVSTDAGTTFAAANVTPAIMGNANVSALAYGPGATAQSDWWVGTTWGRVGVGTNTGAPTAWANTPLPASAFNMTVTRIAVHPKNANVVAVATGGNIGVSEQGRIYLTHDRGGTWVDITGVAAALPPCPIVALAWDPQPLPAQPQTLFAGTLAGVYVARDLTRLPAASAVLAAFNPTWRTFNARGGPGALPLTLVNDLQIVTLAARSGADVVAQAAETVKRFRLVAALYGRGIFACDITRVPAPSVPVGGRAQRLYIRQTVVEDGQSYPRPKPADLNAVPDGASPWALGGDPRFPAGALNFTDREAFDIRIDNAPFQFFDDVIDGVEFDEDLRTRPLAAGERNVVYVQVHSCGWGAVPEATVHLYFAPASAPGAAPLPDLHADFWTHWLDATLPPPAVAPTGNAAAWQRAGSPVTLRTVGPNQPAVARIEWLAPAGLPAFAALLALVTTPAAGDPLTPAGQPTVMKTLLRRERRAAFRLTPVSPFVPDVYVRDGLDDIGRLGGVAFGGRSPDILVFQAEIPAPLRAGVASLTTDPRSGDRVATGDNFVYVRVLNRKAVDTAVDVELFWAQANPPTSAAADPAGPLSDNTKWQAVPAVGAVTNVVVPAGGAVLVEFKFSARPAAVAEIANALAFIALIKAHNPGDPEPLKSRVTDPASVWRFFLQGADANNAALRTVLYAA